MCRLLAILMALVVAAQPVLAFRSSACCCEPTGSSSSLTQAAAVDEATCCSRCETEAPSERAPSTGEHPGESDGGCGCPMPCCGVPAQPSIAPSPTAPPPATAPSSARVVDEPNELCLDAHTSRLKRPPRTNAFG